MRNFAENLQLFRDLTGINAQNKLSNAPTASAQVLSIVVKHMIQNIKDEQITTGIVQKEISNLLDAATKANNPSMLYALLQTTYEHRALLQEDTKKEFITNIADQTNLALEQGTIDSGKNAYTEPLLLFSRVCDELKNKEPDNALNLIKNQWETAYPPNNSSPLVKQLEANDKLYTEAKEKFDTYCTSLKTLENTGTGFDDAQKIVTNMLEQKSLLDANIINPKIEKLTNEAIRLNNISVMAALLTTKDSEGTKIVSEKILTEIVKQAEHHHNTRGQSGPNRESAKNSDMLTLCTLVRDGKDLEALQHMENTQQAPRTSHRPGI